MGVAVVVVEEVRMSRRSDGGGCCGGWHTVGNLGRRKTGCRDGVDGDGVGLASSRSFPLFARLAIGKAACRCV